MKKRVRRVSKAPITKLKKQLWQLCRAIIIKRYGDTCYSCGALGLRASNLQVGHFIPSSVCSTESRYSLENLRPQCMVCNIHRSGNWPAYERHLLADGIDIEALKRRNEETKGEMYRADWYQTKIAAYAAILAQESDVTSYNN